jgi:hypothetical protein
MAASFTLDGRTLRVRCNLTRDRVLRDFAALSEAPETVLLAPTWQHLHCDAPCPRPLGTLPATQQRGKWLSVLFHWRLRLKASSVHRKSAEEMLRAWRRDPAPLLRAQRRLGCSLYVAMRLNSALQSVVHFRPAAAAAVAVALGAEACLDFSAGWGDRLTGFLAAPSVRRIELIEPRADACAAYWKQKAFVRGGGGDGCELAVHCGAAEDVLPELRRRGRTFDLIMSSPPYFNLETYDDGHLDQVSERYRTCDAYLAGFLLPVTLHGLAMLSPRGVLAVNVADNPARGVRYCDDYLKAVRSLIRGTGFCLVGTLAYETRSNPAALSSGAGADCIKAEPVYVFARRGAAASQARARLLASWRPPRATPSAPLHRIGLGLPVDGGGLPRGSGGRGVLPPGW